MTGSLGGPDMSSPNVRRWPRATNWAIVSWMPVLNLLAKRIGYDALFDFWEKRGLHVLPVSFYSPLPVVSELDEAIWARPSTAEMAGIDWNEAEQMKLLQAAEALYRAELDALFHPGAAWPFHGGERVGFRGIDARILYVQTRVARPKRFVEVGAGASSHITAAALKKNREDGYPCDHLSIEPFPNPDEGVSNVSDLRLVEAPVQTVPLDVFTSLERDDILFIDSTHVSRIESDVNHEFFEILPRLQPGVRVHLHDIFWPYNYPKNFIFWNEQYLLRAFLLFNERFVIDWGSAFMKFKHDARLEALCPEADAGTLPGSFWMRS